MTPSISLIQRLIRPLLVLPGLAGLALKRLLYRPALTLLALGGIVLAVSLVTSAGFFARAVDRVLLGQELARFAQQVGRPAFSMRVYQIPDADTPLGVEDAERLAPHVGGSLASEIGLPLQYAGVEVESGDMAPEWPTDKQPAKAAEPAAYAGGAGQIDSVQLVYFQDIQKHINIQGDALDASRSGERLDVWVNSQFAKQAGIDPGDEFAVRMTIGIDRIPVRVKGIWQARDPKEPFWFSDPNLSLNAALLVRRQDYAERVQPLLASKSRFVAWHVILDESQIAPGRAREYVTGFQRAIVVVQKYLPSARLDYSPLDSLTSFVQRNRALTILLLAFDVPAFGFLLYFLVLTSAIIARWQRRETAGLVSRGAGRSFVMTIVLLEELLLFLIGAPLGAWLGLGLAQFMGHTVSFLSFTPRPPLPVSLREVDLPLLAITLLVALLARLGPALGAARHGIVEQERQQARPQGAPFWQRYALDLLLIIPTVYAYRQLAQRGTLALLVQDRPADLYQDPLLILVPALFVLAASLLAMRIFPLLTWLMDRVAGLVPWITPHLALRQLGRGSQGYINPLLLIIACLALGIYTYSLAASLDQWLIDRVYYSSGADLVFTPLPLSQATGMGAPAAKTSTERPAVLPIEDYLGLPGVAAGTRVGDYGGQTTLAQAAGDGSQSMRFLGIDRLTFPGVAWFRDDLADESLGGLMNRLAVQPDGILVSQAVLDESQLQIGDQIQIYVNMGQDAVVDSRFTIVGAYRHFPTVYNDKITVIGNFDYLCSFFNVTMPHNVWLRLQPGARGSAVIRGLENIGLMAGRAADSGALIAVEQAQLERVGVFGTLSVGFLAAALMAFTALLINTYASLNERLYRFAVLHAMGLERRQILGQVLIEYIFLTVYGAALGGAIGAAAAGFFAPFFRVTGAREIVLPPLLPVIAGSQILNLTAIFAGVMVTLELAIIADALYRRLFRMLALRYRA
jgi:putative ABC transport system permease protein